MIKITSLQNFHPRRHEMNPEKLHQLIDEKVRELLEVNVSIGSGTDDKAVITLMLRIKDENEELNVTHEFKANLDVLR